LPSICCISDTANFLGCDFKRCDIDVFVKIDNATTGTGELGGSFVRRNFLNSPSAVALKLQDTVVRQIDKKPPKQIKVKTRAVPIEILSAPAKVTRKGGQYRIVGAAWGAPIDRVEVQIDQGPWQPATLDRSEQAEYAWTIWSFDWTNPAPGEHTITARAIDTAGNIQPSMDDPLIAKKHTYWESNGQVTRRILI
jgi:hypothetical protein